MRLLLVDDERLSLKNLERVLRKICPEAELVCADNYKDALAAEGQFQAAFLDIEMPEMDGLELAGELRRRNRYLNVIFVTAYSEYALDAYQMHASGYLTKPYVMADVERELQNLRYPNEAEHVSKPLKIVCFGEFEVLYDGKPIHFERRGAKEILAYLIHLRGATATRLEISNAIWESEEEVERRKTYFRTLILSLRKTLEKCGAEELFISYRDSFAVNTNLVDCDYYRYLEGDTDSSVRYNGAYMSQYRWGDETREQLAELR